MLFTKPWVAALLVPLVSNLPTPNAFLLPTPSTSSSFLKLRSSTALAAHSHLQAALQLIQGAASSPSATAASGTSRSGVCVLHTTGRHLASPF